MAFYFITVYGNIGIKTKNNAEPSELCYYSVHHFASSKYFSVPLKNVPLTFFLPLLTESGV